MGLSSDSLTVKYPALFGLLEEPIESIAPSDVESHIKEGNPTSSSASEPEQDFENKNNFQPLMVSTSEGEGLGKNKVPE